MHIAAGLHQTKFSRAPHPVLLVAEASLDLWISKSTNEEMVLDLVPAQDWLSNDLERELAWRYLENSEGRSIVPLLVCPDDRDLNCTVVVTEQFVTASSVQWNRFGHDLSGNCDQSGDKVTWFETNIAVTFDRAEFISAIQDFKRSLREA
jgi:hypothetical protein